jgi:hypothetical protein
VSGAQRLSLENPWERLIFDNGDSLKKFQKENLAQGQKDSGNFEDQ